MNKARTNSAGIDSQTGRIVCLDLGEKRIGIAMSDETRTLARSHSVIKRSSRVAEFEKIALLASENEVNLVVVGSPTLSDGNEGSKAAWARDYAMDLSQSIGVQVELWDESFSTIDARASLRVRDIPRRKRKERIDAVAAAFILQSFLDAQDYLNQKLAEDGELPRSDG